MAEAKKALLAKLIIGIMYAEEKIYEQTIEILKQQFGEFEQGPTINFNFTNYYQEETGKNLKKTYVVFEEQINREKLPQIKILTNKIEKDFLTEDKRKINIDPGYLTEHQVVLASAKEHPHRIYLADGIYGQIVLVFCRNEWITVDKTFADYKQKEVQEFLMNIRKNFK